MEPTIPIIQEEVDKFFDENNLSPAVSSQEIAQLVLDNNIYAEYQIGEQKLIFFRFFSPVIMREEIFLGSVLLNSFLSKQLVLTVNDRNLGTISPIANDLEKYFYLFLTNKSIDELKEQYLAVLEDSLVDLFFGDHDEGKGIYGKFKNLIQFEANNYGSFPAEPIPQSLIPVLWEKAITTLRAMIQEIQKPKDSKPILASLSFLLSKDGGEKQSPYLILARSYTKYNFVPYESLSRAFNLEDLTYQNDERKLSKELQKKIVESVKKNTAFYSPDYLNKLVLTMLDKYENLAKNDPGEWRIKHERSIFLDLPTTEYVFELVGDTQLGYHSFESRQADGLTECRCCGSKESTLVDRQIIMGENVSRFHNQSIRYKNKDGEKICARCALCSYLITKLLGPLQIGAKAMPKQFNIIFHYGKHREDEIRSIATKLQEVYGLIKNRKSIRREIKNCEDEIAKNKKEIENQKKEIQQLIEKRDNAKTAAQKQNLQEKVGLSQQRLEQLEKLADSLSEKHGQLADDIDQNRKKFANCKDFIQNPDEEPVFDFFNYARIDISEADNYVFGIGMGGYKLMAFIIPEIKFFDKNKSHDFAQKRFNTSRVSALSLMSFLKKFCGCDGPYYFQTLPTLASDTFSLNDFYFKNERFNADEVLDFYEILANFAKKVTKRSKDALVKQILLAEEMSNDPMVMLSNVMRNSRLGSKPQKTKFNLLNRDINPITGGFDATDYLKVYQKLHEQLVKEY